MTKLMITFVLAFFAGNIIARYGRENEWTTVQTMLLSILVGAVIGTVSHYINL